MHKIFFESLVGCETDHQKQCKKKNPFILTTIILFVLARCIEKSLNINTYTTTSTQVSAIQYYYIPASSAVKTTVHWKLLEG